MRHMFCFFKVSPLPLYRSNTSSYAWANSFSWDRFVGKSPGVNPAMVDVRAGQAVEWRGGVGLQTTAVTPAPSALRPTQHHLARD